MHKYTYYSHKRCTQIHTITQSTTWISDRSILCVVPPLPPVRQDSLDASRTLTLHILVNVGGQRSAPSDNAAIVYTGVPAYFKCDNNKVAVDAKVRAL